MLSKEVEWCESMPRQLMVSLASLLMGRHSHQGMTSLDPIPSSRNDEHFSYPFREPSLYGGATSQSREGLLQALLNFPNTDKLPGLLDQFICGPGTQGQRPA